MFTGLLNNLKENRRTIVFTEGPDARILEAAARLKDKDPSTKIVVVSMACGSGKKYKQCCGK